MKQTALLLAVFALLGMMVASDPVFAASNFTSTNTLGSSSFGFAPTAANLKTFTRQTGVDPVTGPDEYCQTAVTGVLPTCTTFTDQPVVGSGLDCTGTTSLVCSAGSVEAGEIQGYVPVANSLPGALTSRPDKTVSTWTDFGCGTTTPTGAVCVEGPPETGINTMSRVLLGSGQNTAPTANSCQGVVLGTPGAPTCAPDGTLTGALNSLVTLSDGVDPDMPSGSVVFNWTPCDPGGPAPNDCSAAGPLADPNNGSATFTVDINHAVSGLYTFSEFDTTNAPVLTYASRDLSDQTLAPGGTGTFGVPHNRAAADTAPPLTLGEKFPTMLDVSVRTTLDLTQTTMGGTGVNSETIGYTVDWAGETFGHPGGGAYFTPGLYIRDWNGNAPPAATPNPPGDGVGFAN
jgi:hypothetical protein